MRITVTGPRSAGKTTLSRLLAERLGYAYVSYDDRMNEALKEDGGLHHLIETDRKDILNRAVMPVVDRALTRDDVVFDLGGGVLPSEVDGIGKRVCDTIQDRSVVVALLPCEDQEETVRVLYARERERSYHAKKSDAELLSKTEEHLALLQPVLDLIAEIIVYADGRSPVLLVEEVLRKTKAL